ncbi:hypothetical protein JRO89_XS13G0083000 [Xanthoceras sorbifolium]|uniref:Uncharacterized protein n=1 Tax=Xanthoceras sorbifolium TaxID=99658 RepID=A0ABQ8H795_9ROSI|nr:hypothetical protein JRO89_XS13G0082600 [Xanthoceras sorbifolium]KAH7549791.1 hypothetical protein JRO89_XS13G0083000 [Xanthoceras sorbifolium]
MKAVLAASSGLWLVMSLLAITWKQAIQIKSTGERGCKVEAFSEEGGISQSHLFTFSAKEEENGGIKGDNGQPWDEKKL